MVKFKFGHANTDEKSLDAILATNEKSHRNDAEHHEDVQNAKELAHDMSEMTRSYFFSVGYLGTMFSFSLTALSAYYGFSCPASILSYINEDIGMYPVFNVRNVRLLTRDRAEQQRKPVLNRMDNVQCYKPVDSWASH